MVRAGLGTPVQNVHGIVPVFRGRNNKIVIGATSVTKFAKTHNNKTTCMTSGRTLVKLAGGITFGCGRGGVHYGTITPNEMRAGLHVGDRGLTKSGATHSRSVKG